jgi:hypothetical protein
MISISKLFKSLDEKGAEAENYPATEVGKHRDKPLENFAADQVKIGLKIEKEHSNVPEVASQITKDHLAEFPDYYTRLVQLEKEATAAKKDKGAENA